MNTSKIRHIYSSLLACLLLFQVSPFLQAQDPLNLELNTWNSLGPYNEWPFPFSRHEHGFVEAAGKMYLIGGRGNKPVQIYDPQTNTWEMGAQPPLEIHHMQLVPFQGKIYVIGAQTGQFPYEDPVGSILIYDIATDSWQWGAAIPANRQRGSTGVVVYNNKMYVICGIINGHTSGWVKWLDVYDPITDNWQTLPDAPNARDHFHAALVGDKIVVAGGRRSGADGVFNATVGAIDVYSISDNSWSTIGSIPTQRAGCSAVTIGSEVVIIGGESGSQQAGHVEVEAIDINTGNWRTLSPLNQGRHAAQATIYNNAIYIAGGSIERGANELPYTDPNYMEAYPFDDPGDIPPDDPPNIPQAPNASIAADVISGDFPLSVNFDASGSFDPDGEIVSYDWDFGDGHIAQGINVNHIFETMGTYTVSLTVTDSSDMTGTNTVEIQVSDPNQRHILFLSESSSSDLAIQGHLENMGFQVTTLGGAAAQTEDALDKNLIIVSSTISSSIVNNKFTNVNVPLINWEPYLYDDLFMVSSASEVGWMSGNAIEIVDPLHPLAANLYDTVSLYESQQQISWAVPGSSAARVGVSVSNPAQSQLFAYDRGDTLANGSIAVARRIGFPLGDQAAIFFTEEGWRLFDVAVCWAMNCNPININATATPQSGSVPLTVNFDASASSHLYGSIVSYIWQLGDSTYVTDTMATYTYDEVGTYYPSILLIDQYGNTATDTFEIEVLPAPPTAIWVANGDSSFAPAVVIFDARASFDVDGQIVRYDWDFGDGMMDSLVVDSLPVDSMLTDSLLLDSLLQITHIYEYAGTYTSILYVMDNDSAIASDTVIIEVINTAPVADLMADTSSGYAPLTVQFDASNSWDFDGNIVEYIISYGDGISDSIAVDSSFADSLLAIPHTYTLSGLYDATLIVTDNLGLSDSSGLQIEVLNMAPIAVPTTSLDTGLAPLTVLFSAESSYDSDGQITDYLWTLPNMEMDTLSETNYTFDRWGDHVVNLRVTDNGGLTDQASLMIHIINQAPTALATSDRLSGVFPLEVNFSGEGSSDIDGDIVAYSWAVVGDSSNTEGMTSTYTFEEVGSYQAVLTVVDDAGASSTDTLNITVTPQLKDVLLVVGSGDLSASDMRVQEILIGMGFKVVVVSDIQAQTSDAEDKALVVISSSSHSGSVNSKFTDVAVAVLTWEAFLYDDMKMTASSKGTDYQFVYNQSSIDILDSSHPMAAGLSGSVAVYPGGSVMSWGNPSAEAVKIASVNGDPSKTAIFGYETGSMMVGMPAPARRVGLFVQDNQALILTNAGLSLFEAAICWASGCTAPVARKAAVATNFSLEAFPNPARNSEQLTMTLSMEEAGQAEISLLDLMGKVHIQKQITLPRGTSIHQISLNRLSAGMYNLLVRYKEGTKSKKVMIIH